MHYTARIAVPASLILVLALTLAGCTESATAPTAGKPGPAAGAAGPQHDHAADHDHDHALPADLPAGIAALKEHHQEIKAAFAAGDAEKAHDPLHHVGELLEALPELGRTAGLSAEQLATLTKSVDQMLAAYGQVDEAMHAGTAPDYDAVAAELDAALAAIEGLAASR
jgi:hypothetical protein